MAGEPNAPAETTTSFEAFTVLNDLSASGQDTVSLVNSMPTARLSLWFGKVSTVGYRCKEEYPLEDDARHALANPDL
jgi:hypothetical protein